MHVALVTSPGAAPSNHWSQGVTAALASELLGRNARVSCLIASRAGRPPVPVAGAEVTVLPMAPLPGVARVAADNRHLALELALTALARRTPLLTVVHVGAGARGSPNVCWLADRLGLRCFAVVRGEEVVCHRNDLVFADGSPCTDFLDPERCRRCCTTSWLRRPPADGFRSRADLLVASLTAAELVFVPGAADCDRLIAFGVPERTITIASEPAAIAARLCG